MTLSIRIPDVCERDIDLLLLEEFVASRDFRSWFLSQIGCEQTIALEEAYRSVKTTNGESDLELTFNSSAGLVKILIENKVDAAFQPNQPQRYAERAVNYRSLKIYGEVVTVVVAPEIYFGNETEAFGFDAKVTYEALLSWFENAQLGDRRDYKLVVLRSAIERGRQGWKLVPHHGVGEFWRSYWRICEGMAPELSMPVPKSAIPAGSHFILFRPAILPSGISLSHKVGYGHVDLQFAGMGDRLAQMEQLYRSVLPPSMRIEKAAKSAVVRMRVEPIDIAKVTFPDAEVSVRQGINAARLLLDWYMKTHQLSTTTAAQVSNIVEMD